MLGHRHQGGQGNALAAAFGHEAGAQAVTPKIPLQSGQSRPSLHDRSDRGRGEGATRIFHSRRKIAPSP